MNRREHSAKDRPTPARVLATLRALLRLPGTGAPFFGNPSRSERSPLSSVASFFNSSRAVCAAAIAVAGLAWAPAAAQADFGIEPGSLSAVAESEGGNIDNRASIHPFAWKLAFKLNVNQVTGASEGGELRDILVDLPRGMSGNPFATARCTRQEFEGFLPSCSPNSQVGIVYANIPGLGNARGPIYNLVPPPGMPLQLGFSASGLNAFQNISVRTEDEYGVRSTTNSLPLEVTSVQATIWGTPAESAHDGERGLLPSEGKGGETKYVGPHLPFLTMPAQCEEPLATTVSVDSKLAPGVYDEKTAYSRDPGGNLAALSGCGEVPFKPQIASQVTTKLASSPSGLDFELKLPNEGLLGPNNVAETEPRKVEVALPEGVTANPSFAEGIATCSEEQFKAEQIDTGPGQGCPEAAKLGSILAHTPLLDEPVEGSLYLAAPYENPEHSLIAVYIVARARERGVLIKQAGRVEPDPRTGQLISTFEGLPPLPYSDFTLHFREGGRAPLISPPSCGTYTTTAKLYPFSAPSSPVERDATFKIERGADGGACPSGGLPFHPGFEAGTLNNAAGAHSPLYMRLTRKDGDQDLTKLSTTLPPGLLASLVGVGRCSDAEIAQARSRTGPHGGAEELASPSCPASSQIGQTMTGAGVGGTLLYVPGKAYLAGPYHGAPLSVVAIVPGVAGPFDVGTVVVRLALRFNPITAQAEADGAASDPIPHILRGIPLAVRDIRVYVDRPGWTFNPTSCEPEATLGTLWGGGQDVFSVADDSPFALAARFQAADCASLGFQPSLSLRLKGGTKRGKFPALRGEYVPRAGDANLKGLVLRLPHSEFVEQGHFKTICTRVQYAAGAGFGSQCPAGSVYGWATAYTPLLEEPLEGPVRLRSSSHNLPDLVASLHGIADIEAVARIDSVHGELRASFAGLPDAPLTKVVVSMQGGRKGLIVNSTNICLGKHRAKAQFSAQSGKGASAKPALKARCKKAQKGKKGKKKAKRRNGGSGR
jgi:hypothetical protein